MNRHTSAWMILFTIALTTPSSPVRAENIRLSTGEVLTVDILESTSDTIRIRHPVLGEITLARSAVEVLPPQVEAGAPASQQAEQDAIAAEAAAGAEAAQPVEVSVEPPPKEWKLQIVAGAGLTEGNSETRNLNSKFLAVRDVAGSTLTFDASYFYAEDSGEESDNRFSAGVRHDWKLDPSRWFFFAQGRYDHDEFQDWDDRVAVHGGVGYKLILPPPFSLAVRAGAGANREFGGAEDEWRPELLFGVEGAWEISTRQKLVFDSTIYPDLDESGEYRWISNAGWSLLMDEKMNLSLTVGLQYEYQSDVPSDREKDDLRVFAGLQLDF